MLAKLSGSSSGTGANCGPVAAAAAVAIVSSQAAYCRVKVCLPPLLLRYVIACCLCCLSVLDLAHLDCRCQDPFSATM